jgi:Tol biopolymer transport system component
MVASDPHVVLFVDAGGGVDTVGADGSGLRRLDRGVWWQAIWAPDGTRVAFWGCCGSVGLSVRSLRGGVPREVMPGFVMEAVWSPDGRWIVGRRRLGEVNRGPFPRKPVRYALYRVHPDGSGLRRITSWTASGFSLQGWSPDSRRLLTIRDSTLALLDLNGNATAIPGVGDVLYAAWSPDGRTIAYARDAGFPPQRAFRGLWLVRPDGSGLRQLTTGTQFGPAWSPDSRRIAFTEIRTIDGQYVIGTVDVASGTQTSLVRDDHYVDQSPSWSPDGNWLVFSRRPNVDGTRDQYLWVVSADGTDAREISHHLDPGSTGTWKPR